MDLKDKELVKSLTSLIDETLDEIEEIKKSKYAASEIKIEGPGDGIAGKPVNGKLDAKKSDDDNDDDDDDEDEDKKKMDKMEDCDMDKGENEKADQDHGKFAKAPTVAKGENEKADPDHGKFAESSTVAKKEDEEDEEDEEKDKKKKKFDFKDLKKSVEESEDLMKSYVDHKFEALNERFSAMAEMIEAMADAPVGRRGVPAGIKPLNKSADETYETLTKSGVANSLFELKKSGENVDSSDIFRVETSKNYDELQTIANKYGVK